MGVMKHRRKPGISSKEGQKWWRQLISKPLMWDLRVTVTTRSSRTASKSKTKPSTTSSLKDDARRWREGAAAPRDAEAAPVVVLVRHDHEVAVAQRLDVLGRVLRAEAEAQDLDDVLDLRCGAGRGAPGAVGRLSRPRRRRRGDRVTQACRIEWRATSSPRAGVAAALPLVRPRRGDGVCARRYKRDTA